MVICYAKSMFMCICILVMIKMSDYIRLKDEIYVQSVWLRSERRVLDLSVFDFWSNWLYHMLTSYIDVACSVQEHE